MLELIAAATTIHPNLFGVLWVLAAVFSLGLFVRHRFFARQAGKVATHTTEMNAAVKLWLIAFAPLLVISLVSVINTSVPLSRIEVAEVLIGGAFLAAGLQWIRISQERLINAAVIGSLFALGIAIVDLTLFDYGRAGRSFHPINFAVAVGCLLIVLTHAVIDTNTQRRPIVLAGLTAGVIAMILSESRGPMLAIILSVGLTWAVTRVFRRSPESDASKTPTWIWTAGLGIALTLVLFAGWRTWNELQALGQSASVQVRLQILIATLNQIRETPIFGIGADQAGKFFAAVTLPEQGINHAHSSLLNTTLEMGLPGGLAWCWAFLVLGWGFLREVRQKAQSAHNTNAGHTSEQNLNGSREHMLFTCKVGLSLVLFFFLCSLTQDLLSHSFTRKLIAFYPVLFLAMLSQASTRLSSRDSSPSQSR